MITKIHCLILFLFIGYRVQAQDTLWHHKKCAVVLTYDDGLDVDIDNVVPALDSLGLKATFYVSNYSGTVDARPDGWRAIAAKGHELGNHTYYHPCLGNLPGRDFVTPEDDLNNYTVLDVDKEIHVMSTLLKALDGRDARTLSLIHISEPTRRS